MVNAPEAAGRGAGGFLGGLFNNPGVVILGGLAIALAFFSGDIRKAFGSLGESIGSIGDIQLPDIQLPTINFPEITFPSFGDITFPSFGDIFGGGDPVSAPLTQPGEGGFNPADQPVLPTDIDIALGEGATPDDIAGMIGIDPTDPNQDPTLFQPPMDPALADEPSDAELFAQDFPETFVPITPISPILPPGFEGGGVSFEGGTIFENPIDTLTEVLSAFPQLTASQAADFLGEFSGILPSELPGVSPDIINIMGDPSQPITLLPASSEELTGLTPEQIFSQLFGDVQNPDF